MAILKKFRRVISKLTSDKKLVLTLSLFITLLIWDLNRSNYSVMRSGMQAINSLETYIGVPFESQRNKRSNFSNNCEIIDFFATVDVTAHTYNKDLLCDEKAETSDIVCRMHLQQIGLEHLEKSTCALKNPGKVPKIVYFVIFGTYVFKFWHYIAIMGAKRYIEPSAVYVIGDQHPQGRWWQQVLRDVKGVR